MINGVYTILLLILRMADHSPWSNSRWYKSACHSSSSPTSSSWDKACTGIMRRHFYASSPPCISCLWNKTWIQTAIKLSLHNRQVEHERTDYRPRVRLHQVCHKIYSFKLLLFSPAKVGFSWQNGFRFSANGFRFPVKIFVTTRKSEW